MHCRGSKTSKTDKGMLSFPSPHCQPRGWYLTLVLRSHPEKQALLSCFKTTKLRLQLAKQPAKVTGLLGGMRVVGNWEEVLLADKLVTRSLALQQTPLNSAHTWEPGFRSPS